MGTAKEFSYLLRDAGYNAKFSKFDIQDANKIPARKKVFRLQGFQWLGKFWWKPDYPSWEGLLHQVLIG